MDKYKSK